MTLVDLWLGLPSCLYLKTLLLGKQMIYHSETSRAWCPHRLLKIFGSVSCAVLNTADCQHETECIYGRIRTYVIICLEVRDSNTLPTVPSQARCQSSLQKKNSFVTNLLCSMALFIFLLVFNKVGCLELVVIGILQLIVAVSDVKV